MLLKMVIKWNFFFNKSENEKPILGDHVTVELGNVSDVWIRNDKFDIAILYWNKIYVISQRNKNTPFIRTINYKLIPNENEINERIDAIEDILLLGYPDNIYDPKSLIPVVRRGITATPYSLDFGEEPKFLIDASIFPGSSGSPILICDRSILYRKDGWNTGARTFLLGILSEGYFRTRSNNIITKSIPTDFNHTVQSEEMLDWE